MAQDPEFDEYYLIEINVNIPLGTVVCVGFFFFKHNIYLFHDQDAFTPKCASSPIRNLVSLC